MAVGQGARIVLAGCHRTVRYVMCELLYGEQVLINGLYGDSGAGQKTCTTRDTPNVPALSMTHTRRRI